MGLDYNKALTDICDEYGAQEEDVLEDIRSTHGLNEEQCIDMDTAARALELGFTNKSELEEWLEDEGHI